MADTQQQQLPPPIGYHQGWAHGFDAGILAARGQLPSDTVTSGQKWLAAGTLVAGLGSAAVLIVSSNPRLARYRPALGALAVSGIILSSVIGAINVLRGAPTPRLGISA